MYADVQTLCRTCPAYQKTCHVSRSDLQPLLGSQRHFLATGAKRHQYKTTWSALRHMVSQSIPIVYCHCSCCSTVSGSTLFQSWCSRQDHHRPGDKFHLQAPAALPSTVGHYGDQGHPVPPPPLPFRQTACLSGSSKH